MTNEELIEALLSVSVETGSLVCLGCGHEHSCGIRGCAILRDAAEALEAQSAQLAAKDAEIEQARQTFGDAVEGLAVSHDNLSADLARVTAERDAAVALIEKVDNIAVGAIEYGPYQDGEEAKLFFEIETLTRAPAKQGEEG